MNYQNVEALQKLFKQVNGWEVVKDDSCWDIYAERGYIRVSVEGHSSFSDGRGRSANTLYPYVNVQFFVAGRFKTIISCYSIFEAIDFIKNLGKV